MPVKCDHFTSPLGLLAAISKAPHVESRNRLREIWPLEPAQLSPGTQVCLWCSQSSLLMLGAQVKAALFKDVF